jgi:tetratricopeptide (TPR) repeat protein
MSDIFETGLLPFSILATFHKKNLPPIRLAMIERDYIMRMIQMLVQVLARILFLKKGEQYPKALDEIQKASKQILGIELEVFRKLSDLQMIDFLSLDVSLGIPKCYAAGILLKEEAEILAIQKNESESLDTFVKSLSLLTEVAIHNKSPFDTEHARAIESVAGKLKGKEYPVYVQKKLFRYFEIDGQYREAANMLSEILVNEPSFVVEGIGYYERLQKKSDGELSLGDLPRKDVEDVLTNLRQR